MIKGSKTIKVMKGSKNRGGGGGDRSKSYIFFAYKETRNIDIL